jgi:Tol biopolymer transport system component
MKAGAGLACKALARLCVAALIVGAVVSGCGGATRTPTNTRILYVSGPTNLGVRTIGLDGSRLRILTTHPPAGDLPTWVEHGHAISFWGSDEGLWLMPSSGGSARRVARVSDYSTLSPSGTKVAVVNGPLTITDSNGRTLRRYPLKLRGEEGFDSPEHAAWAPNERRVAFQLLGDFTSTGDEPGRLLVVDLASGRIHTIRARGTIDSNPPAWSPDSRKLAFIAGPVEIGTDDLYVSDPDGGGRVRVAHDVSLDQNEPFVWSPDGRRIAFVRTTGSGPQEHPGTIFIVSAQGGDERRIAGGRAIAALAWSPDGRRLAFSAGGGIFVARVGGGTQRVTPRGAGSSVSWAPSNRILFGDAKSIYSIDGAGRGLRELGTQLNDGWPVWSPNGRTIAFVRGHNARGLDVAADVWTMTARGRNERRAGAGYDPSWSPDSRRLAYVRTVGGNPAIVVQPLAGTARIVAHGTSPSWSPDGSVIAFIDGGTQVRVVSPNGKHERVLLDGASFEDVNGVAWEHYIAPIVWAPHGDELAVAAALLEQDGTDDGDRVRVATLPGGASRMLPLFANSGLDWSPDGKTLVGVSEAGLATIPVHGTMSQTIIPSDWPLILTNAAWSPDSRLIAYNSCRREVCEIRVASADGSAQHRVVRLSAPQMSFGFGTNFTSRWQPR